MKKGILFGIEFVMFYIFLVLILPYLLIEFQLSYYNWLRLNFMAIICISLIVCYFVLFYLMIIKKWE